MSDPDSSITSAQSHIRAILSRHHSWLLLVLILVAATLLRLHRLGEASLWFDERFSVMAAEGHVNDWRAMPSNVVLPAPDYTSRKAAGSWWAAWNTADTNPPLYPVLLRAWLDLFGQSDAATRGLSVAASVIAIVLMYDLGRTLVNERAALWACAIMAVASPQVQYAQEARAYALMIALGLGACAAAARLAARGPGCLRAAALGMCLLGMLLTHFFAVGAAVALAVWGLIRLRGKPRMQAVIACGIAAIIFALIAGFGVLPRAYALRGDTTWLGDDPHGHFQRMLWRAALLPARFLCEPREGTESAAAFAAVLYLLPFLMLRRNRAMLLAGLWLVGAVGFISIVDLIRVSSCLAYVRYTIVAAPAVYLMIAALPVRWSVLRQGVPLLVIFHCLLALPDMYDASIVQKGDWRQLGDDVRHFAHPGDLIVILGPKEIFLGNAFQIYPAIDYYARPIPCPIILLDQKLDPALDARLRHTPNVWVITGLHAKTLASYLPGWRLEPAGTDHRFADVLYRLVANDRPDSRPSPIH